MKTTIERDELFLSLIEENIITVSESGEVYNNITNKIIGFTTTGYRRINMFGITYPIHRLVYLIYVGIIPDGFVINHLDGNKLNNYYKNLEACSETENHRHATRVLGVKYGEHLKNIDNRGEKNGKAKLTNELANDIRELKKNGVSVKLLAKEFNVSETCIKHVVSFKTFKEQS